MATDYKFEGWMGLDPSSGEGNMVWQEFQPKNWEETDVDIKISHCGICGSDLHTLRSGWVSSFNTPENQRMGYMEAITNIRHSAQPLTLAVLATKS
jgi:hypothetical protein